MRYLKFYFTYVLIAAVAFWGCQPVDQSETLTSSTNNAPKLDDFAFAGANVLAFGPDQVLFVGDSKNAVVHAIETSGDTLADPVPYNLIGIDQSIAKSLGIATNELIINDMKVHPVSQVAYIAVKKGHQPDAKSFIAMVNPMGGDISLLNLAKATKTEVKLDNPVNPDFNFWKDVPASTLNITDIDYHNGHVYVAGLTNGEFASNLRKIAYPFSETQAKVASIEMYHAVHTQMETRAPIRTMLFEDLNGESSLVASYTCTPLVTIPTAAITEGNHVKAKTIAELGYGNAPIDMVSFMTQEQDGSFDKKILITHQNRGGTVISVKDLAAANKKEGMKGFTYGPEGLPIFQVSTANVLHIDNQNQMFLAMLRRNMTSGALDLVSELKGSYFRLSDFIAEYNFPDYEYPAEQEGTKKYHDMIKPMEGYPELTSENKGK
ncbi:MAG: hypothetical protein AAFV80_07970 [Bacteroidota bacterium]